MEKRYDPRVTLEQTATYIDEIEHLICVGDTPLLDDPFVQEVQGAMQNRVAYAASELMTGMRLHHERQLYLDAYSELCRLMKAVALDTAYRAYDETGDKDFVKKTTKAYLQTVKLQMVALDYKKRLGKSSWERAKQSVAQNDRARTALPFALTLGSTAAGFGATAAFLKNNETPALSSIELSPSVTSLVGAVAVGAAIGTRPLIRSMTRQFGSLLGNQVNLSLLAYMIDKFDKEGSEEAATDLESVIGQYAMRDLKSTLAETGNALLDYDFATRDDINPMIDNALKFMGDGMHKHYGIDPECEWPGKWYVRIPSKILRVNLAVQR